MKSFFCKLPVLILVTLIFSSCWPKKGIVLFKEAEGSSFLKENYKESVNDPNAISVLLRVPQTPAKASEIGESAYSGFYNTIESELVKNGFIVRDRQIFNELISNRNENISQLAKGTETDIIIEIVELDLGVGYKTDNFIKKNSNKKIFLRNGLIQMNGVRVKFKIFSIKKNELIGALEFNYAPCEKGCDFKIDKDGTLYSYRNGKYIRVKNYQIVEKDQFEEFAKQISKNLINKIK